MCLLTSHSPVVSPLLFLLLGPIRGISDFFPIPSSLLPVHSHYPILIKRMVGCCIRSRLEVWQPQTANAWTPSSSKPGRQISLGENFSSGGGKGINQLSKCQACWLLRKGREDAYIAKQEGFGLHLPAFVLNGENVRWIPHASSLSPWCFPECEIKTPEYSGHRSSFSAINKSI